MPSPVQMCLVLIAWLKVSFCNVWLLLQEIVQVPLCNHKFYSFVCLSSCFHWPAWFIVTCALKMLEFFAALPHQFYIDLSMHAQRTQKHRSSIIVYCLCTRFIESADLSCAFINTLLGCLAVFCQNTIDNHTHFKVNCNKLHRTLQYSTAYPNRIIINNG